MIAHFYIINETFAYPASNPLQEEIENAIKAFVIDYDYIRQNKEENKIYFNSSIFMETIFPDMAVEDFYYPQKTSNWDKDVVRALQTIWEKSEESTFEVNNVLENLTLHSEEECFGIIGLHAVEFIQDQKVESIYLVYNQRNWLDFRRYFLGIYPVNADFFIDECGKYFPETFFHENNKSTIPKILVDFSERIIFHLAGLNDDFIAIREQYGFLPEALQVLSAKCGFDELASLEGNAENKKRLNFNFENDSKNIEIVCCEPHIKLSKNNAKSQKYFFNRIYFHEPKPNIQNGKILVAHIGEHL